MKKRIKKEITFVYSDSAEKNMFQLISQEAEKRGYTTKMTMNKFEKCEIGFYCQHVNFPENSKFSVIMLHDIIQQYSNWPDIWYLEPWNIYDVGILPSNQWEKNWLLSSDKHYAHPRYGVYKIGWPKADVIDSIQKKSYKEEFYKKNNLDLSKKTILYAPAWENDGKQDDFVKSMQQLNVNILIKQAPWNKKEYPEIYDNVKKMEKLHSGLPGVCILPMETNIFEAIAVSDVLVSEESSTMCEAAMMGIPAVSVGDWLIPDVVPSRFPKCDYDFVTLTTKNNLSKTVTQILEEYDLYKKKVNFFKNNNFSNIGSTSKMIMDVLDSVLFNCGDCVEPLVPLKPVKLSRQKEKERIKNQKKIKLVEKSKYFGFYNLMYRFYKAVFKK